VCEERAVRREVDERGADRTQPRERFEREASGLAEEHQAFDAGAGAVEHDRTPAVRDAVFDPQLAVEDAQADAVAVYDENWPFPPGKCSSRIGKTRACVPSTSSRLA
jgi:hypothetical protein